MNLTGQAIYEKGQKPAVSKVIRNASRNETCTLMIPGVCTHDIEQTAGDHMRFFGIAGAAQKPDDIFILDGCSACHRILDSRDKWAEAKLGWDDVLRAFMMTLQRRRAAGLIALAGE